MRLFALAFASTLLAAPTLAVGAASNLGGSDAGVRWEDFADPEFDPAEPGGQTPAAVARAHAIPMGPFGIDAEGVRGRIHTVASGETLWDISDAYLGTPWVWPAVWNENENIDDPHVIEPGDQIWITSNEMRLVTPAEAEELVSTAVVAEETVVAAFNEPPDEMPLEVPLPEESELEELPSLEPMMGSTEAGQVVSIPPEQTATIVSSALIAAASRIVDSPTIRVMLTQGDDAYLAIGEGETAVDDEFSIFREVRDIRDPKTNALLGHHIEQIGWLKVRSVEGLASIATIEEATDEIQRGDRIITRQRPVREVSVRMADPTVVGHIALTPGNRVMVGSTDSVYLNVGAIHGIELGTKLEVYSGTGEDLDLPGAVLAEMVVIKVEPQVSVAFVTEARRELQVGDEVRGSVQKPTQAALAY